MRRRPDFIIIGAMKCATTTLHVQLSRQDGFHMSRPKEPNFFSDDERYAQGPGWYESLFEDAAADALCGESSTHYTKLPTYPRTLDRLAEHVPGAKLIYVMRDPIERLISQYVHERRRGRLTTTIDDALARRPELIDYGRYAMQLAPYLERFGAERILPVFFERLCDHGPEQLARVCRFLGYEGRSSWSERDTHKNVARRPSLMQRLFRRDERPIVSGATEQYLRGVFDEDLSRLGGWLGEDLTSANFRTAVDRPSLEWSADRCSTESP